MTNSTTFQESMKIECEKCGREAQQHRLTPSGNMFCLVIRRQSDSWWKLTRYGNPARDEKTVAALVPVRELEKGIFPFGLGEALQAAISGFVEMPE